MKKKKYLESASASSTIELLDDASLFLVNNGLDSSDMVAVVYKYPTIIALLSTKRKKAKKSFTHVLNSADGGKFKKRT